MADALKWLALRRAAAQAAPLVPSKSEPQEVPGEKSAEDGGFIEVDEIEPISLTSTFQNIWFSKALSKAQ